MGQSEDKVGEWGGGEQIVEKSWDVRLPRLSHKDSSATANMTSRAGASVFPPATSLFLLLPEALTLFIDLLLLLLLHSFSYLSHSDMSYSRSSEPVGKAKLRVEHMTMTLRKVQHLETSLELVF